MDQMIIKSDFAKNMLGRLIARIIRQQFGINVTIGVKGLEASIDDNDARVHLELDLTISKSNIPTILGL